MGIVYVILAVLIATPLLYLASLKGQYHVRRSRNISCDINTVFDKLRDFKSWPEWSPWLIHEPDTLLSYSDSFDEPGGYYTWDGKFVGAGKLTHLEFDRPVAIRQKLEFQRPFKSICQIGFDLKETGNGTGVSWSMHGHMPFLLRFMIRRMVPMIQKDYDLGLAMLAGQLDPEAEYPRISFEGECRLQEVRCLCKGFAGNLPDMQKAMQSGFPELAQYVQDQGARKTGTPRSVYHKVNSDKMYFECDMAVPVTGEINQGPYSLKTCAAGRYFRTVLRGHYDYLPLVLYSAFAHLQMYKIRVDRSRPSIEIYENDPQDCASSNEWITGVYIPIR